MDGYQTTVLKSLSRVEQVVLWLLSTIFIAALFFLYNEPGAQSVVAPFAFFLFLLTIYVSRASASAHLTWGPKGFCYNEGFFNKTIAFEEVGGIISRKQLANKKECIFLIVEDKNGRERFKINTSLFDDSDIDVFVRCVENNTSARRSLVLMQELREKKAKGAFVVDTDQIRLTERQR